MKKIFKLLMLLFIFYLFIQIIFNIFSKGYETKYEVDKFKVYEKRIKKTKNEIDNYYFEITKEGKTFSFQTNDNISSTQQVIKEIKYFKDDNYECVLPIAKNDKIISDILCEKNGIYYNYDVLTSKDRELDKFAESLSKYRESFKSDDKVLKSDTNITVYNNIESDQYLGLEYYKGIYLLTKKNGYTNSQIFTKDIYSKELSTFINDNYVVADYNEEYDFRKFYVINLKNHTKTTITSDKKISMYSYIQGVVNNSIYIIDITNKLQYEVDIKNKTVTIVGNEKNGIKKYKNGNWEKASVYEAINNKLYFDEYEKMYNGTEYARVDNIGGDKSGYYYLYKLNNNNYDVYRINKQNDNNITYLFTTDDIEHVCYDFDTVVYKYDKYIKIYSNLTGNKKLAQYDEVEFNKSLKFDYTR